MPKKKMEENREEEGRKEGEDALGTLIDRLYADNRLDEIRKAAVDRGYRKRLFQTHGIH
ncbi:MAG: hypothetical protein IJ468_01545 [Lachnospiraceae bacterium]|nr:hypothetical protein [Lachnospiraceae bacterium]